MRLLKYKLLSLSSKLKSLLFLFKDLKYLGICFAFLFSYSVFGQDNKLEFLRLTDNALQTPIYTLSNKDSSIRVKVIGVIHVGDLRYYQQLQRIIRDLDYLFYEGIKMTYSSKSAVDLIAVKNEPDRTKQDVKTFTNLQNQIAISFKFVEQADYLKPESNWINADVNLNQFTEILQKTNLSLEELSRNLTLDNRNIFEQDNESRESLRNETDQNKVLLWYKKKMAGYLIKSAKDLCFNEEMRIPREAIIVERNKVALGYLKEKLINTNPSELGLLYGAAHIPHFVETLKRDHDLEINSIEWVDAWSLKTN